MAAFGVYGYETACPCPPGNEPSAHFREDRDITRFVLAEAISDWKSEASNQRVESEYFASLRAYGQWIGDIDSAASFPVNPGDPAGRWQEMTDVHPSLSVIDGSFRDIAPDRSRIPAASFIGAAILKGLGKFRALTGLGPDFAVGDSVPTARLAAWFGQQPVSRSALTTGTAEIDDAVWVEVPRS